MKYRKPTPSIIDRHILMELDIDKHDEYDVKHILNKAYLNHKAPHEYHDLKRYMRDIVIGKHNSVYIMNDLNPHPWASPSILCPFPLYNASFNIYLNSDAMATIPNNYGLILTQSSGGCNSAPNSWTSGLNMYSYNNGTALIWDALYLPVPFNKATSIQPGQFVVGPGSVNDIPVISPKYAYAPYTSSTNPLTLTTYYYWENTLQNTLNDSYVYFTLYPSSDYLVPLFYSQGSYTFSPNTYYITMWQWTYQ